MEGWGGGGDERGEMVEGLGVRLYADKTLVVSLLSHGEKMVATAERRSSWPHKKTKLCQMKYQLCEGNFKICFTEQFGSVFG